MNQEHEYTLLGGVNRSKVGRYIALLSATTSAVIVFLLLTVVDFAKRLGIPANVPPSVLSLLGAAFPRKRRSYPQLLRSKTSVMIAARLSRASMVSWGRYSEVTVTY
jgi:hypothetical protein